MYFVSWDFILGIRIRCYVGYEEGVILLDLSKCGEEMFISGSNDGIIGIWDLRMKYVVDYIEMDFFIMVVVFLEVGNEIYLGGIDNDIKVWDVRKKVVVYIMLGY